MECRDLYLRITTPSGKSSVRQHRVWDADRFIAATVKQEAKEGNTVEAVDKAAYAAEHKARS